jgi:nitroreductase
MLNDISSALALLATRRSSRPRDLVEPGPSAQEMASILTIAARTPDHGKLHPWRFIVVDREQRAALARLLERAYLAANPDAGRTELEASQRFAEQSPALVVVLCCPVQESKIPVWEQELSCGAAVMNLLHAVHAHGYRAGWVTGWATFSDLVRDAFGGPGDRIAGFVFIGTPAAEPEERPRPNLDAVMQSWSPPEGA